MGRFRAHQRTMTLIKLIRIISLSWKCQNGSIACSLRSHEKDVQYKSLNLRSVQTQIFRTGPTEKGVVGSCFASGPYQCDTLHALDTNTIFAYPGKQSNLFIERMETWDRGNSPSFYSRFTGSNNSLVVGMVIIGLRIVASYARAINSLSPTPYIFNLQTTLG